jgi:predicted ATPase
MMIESIEFTNFKALRKATLPLEPFTLLLGPNGSGKSTVLQALAGLAEYGRPPTFVRWPEMVSRTAEKPFDSIGMKVRFHGPPEPAFAIVVWENAHEFGRLSHGAVSGAQLPKERADQLLQFIRRMRIFALNPDAIAGSATIAQDDLKSDGSGLAAVLDDLHDNCPERWEALLAEMREWLPEYDSIGFDKPGAGRKVINLRTRRGSHAIPGGSLSQGTLVAVALLTLCYLPNPPSLIGLEEIDRGLHPRLLRHLQDALYRLAYPQNFGETRPPVQVIATTHSPYLLDLYREHPEEIVLAQKKGLEVQFKRLSDIEHFQDILGDSPLSDVWYSGVLGGVSVEP